MLLYIQKVFSEAKEIEPSRSQVLQTLRISSRTILYISAIPISLLSRLRSSSTYMPDSFAECHPYLQFLTFPLVLDIWWSRPFSSHYPHSLHFRYFQVSHKVSFQLIGFRLTFFILMWTIVFALKVLIYDLLSDIPWEISAHLSPFEDMYS